MALRTLVVDDEPLAVERMQILCAALPELALVGTATDGDAALRLIGALAPDLVLLDIAIPGLDGIGVAAALEGKDHPAASGCGRGEHAPPAVIFCTAFDDFAVAAFDVAAVGYLLKPVTPEGLARAVARVGERRRLPATAAPDHISEFWVPHRSEVVRVDATQVDRIEAERDYMRLHVGSRSFLLHQTISALERRLDPACFIRIHRSTIVRRATVAKLAHDGLGRWHACLADGQQLKIGRSYRDAVREAFRPTRK